MPVHGVDISRWQGKVDWTSLRSGGTRFAFIKATEGGDHTDPNFRENWEGARNAGLLRGAYHFVYWCRPAEEQAAWFRANVPADPDALPPVLDAEWNGASASCGRKIPRDKALAMIRVMLREMEAHTGKRPIIYTDITFHKDVLEGEFEDHPFWIRSTAAEPHVRYKGRQWTFWQFTTTGRAPGIVGPVDRNAFHGTEAQWREFVSGPADALVADASSDVEGSAEGAAWSSFRRDF
jgi:lysozyme